MVVEQRDGWFVVNVRDAAWFESSSFGRRCSFESEQPFADVGIGIHVLEPGKPNCRYHRESAQEDFLVLSGHCRMIVNGEERALGPWDFVHCPPGTSHVFVGEGDGPCAMLMIGHRPRDHEIFYPAEPLARACGAEAPKPTPDPREAYADVRPKQPIPAPEWPPR